MAPHIAEELWSKLDNSKTLAYEAWPVYNEEYLKSDSLLYPIQVNGKVRTNLEVPADKATDKNFVLEQAKSDEKVITHLEGKELIKEIFVPGRIVNLVVK